MRRQSLILVICLLSPLILRSQDEPQPTSPAKAGPTVRAPIPIVSPEAEVPQQARLKRESGSCLISLTVDSRGMPQHPRVLHCTDPIFTSSSMEAVQKYRFKPATRIADGQPVPVVVTVEINFHGGDQPAPGEPSPRFRYGFSSPPGMTTTEPDENGVYPLSKNLNVPQMKTFVDDGFDLAMSRFPNGFRCSVLLTLDKKGKPLSAHVLKCDEPALEEPVMKSLLESKYRPARLNGKSVPVTMCVTVMHEGVGSHAETAGGQAQHESKP